MKPFKVSQSGKIIAEGIVFSSGTCAVNWLKQPEEHKFFDSLKNFMNSLDSSIEIIDNNKPKKSLRLKNCNSKDPTIQCGECDCWKSTRLNCS